MKENPRSWWQRKQIPLLPLLLIIAINLASFFFFSRVGAAVGAETGTDGYEEIADNLAHGRGFIFAQDASSTMFQGYMKREPMYPLFLAGILLLTGRLSPAVLGFFQTGLALIACCLIYRLGNSVFGTATGRVAALIYAVHPISFWYSTRFAGEAMSVPAMLLSLLAIERAFNSPTHRRAALVGLSVAVAALARSACVTLLPVVLLFALLKWRAQLRQFLSFACVTVAVFLCLQSLWVFRNYAISGEIVPFTTMSGIVFFWGNEVVEHFSMRRHTAGSAPDDIARARYRSVQSDIAASQPGISLPQLEAKTDKRFLTMARELFVEKPGFVVRKFLLGSYLIWFLSDTTAKSLGWMMFQIPVLLVAVVGLYRQRPWSFRSGFLLCVVLAYIIPHTLLSPFARYSLPIIPVVMLFAAHALAPLAERYVPGWAAS